MRHLTRRIEELATATADDIEGNHIAVETKYREIRNVNLSDYTFYNEKSAIKKVKEIFKSGDNVVIFRHNRNDPS